MGGRYLVPCSQLPACAVPLYCLWLRWICNILSGAVVRARSRAALGFEPSVSDFCVLALQPFVLSLHSDRHVTSCLSGSGSTAASFGVSPSSSLSSSSSCCGRCGIGRSRPLKNRTLSSAVQHLEHKWSSNCLEVSAFANGSSVEPWRALMTSFWRFVIIRAATLLWLSLPCALHPPR